MLLTELGTPLLLTNVWAVVFVDGTVSRTCTVAVVPVTAEIVKSLPLAGSVDLGYDF